MNGVTEGGTDELMDRRTDRRTVDDLSILKSIILNKHIDKNEEERIYGEGGRDEPEMIDKSYKPSLGGPTL